MRQSDVRRREVMTPIVAIILYSLGIAGNFVTGQVTPPFGRYDYYNDPDVFDTSRCNRDPTVIPKYFVPFGPDVWDQEAPINDDGSWGVTLQTPFKFFDQTHTQAYINTNGGVSFTTPVSDYRPEHFNLSGPAYDTIVAYWADINTGILGSDGRIYFRQTTDRTVLNNVRHLQRLPSAGEFSALVVTWHNVTYYGGDECSEVNTFQIVLVSSGSSSFVVLNYAYLGWVLSSTSSTAQAGYNSASSGRYYELPGAMSTFPNTFLTASNVNVPGQWVFRVDGGSDDLCQGNSFADSNNTAYPALDPCLLKLVGPIMENSKVVFKCRVNLPTPHPEARAEVKFMFDGEASPSVPAVVVTPANGPEAELHERYLYNNMGKMIQCSVSSFWTSSPDVKSPLHYSDSYFAGIRAPNDVLLLDPGNDQPITTSLYSTIPIACSSTSRPCHLDLRLTSTENVVVHSTSAHSCRYKIYAADWDENAQRGHNSANLLQIRISPLAFPATRGLETISISLHHAAGNLHPRTKDGGGSLPYDNFWHSEKLGSIMVTRAPAQSAVCMSTGDPQMTTFDGLYYGVQQTGVFTLVQSSSTRKFKVEIRHWACTEGQKGCSIGCAVAIREGNVAYGLDMCNRRKAIHRLRLSPQSLSYEPITADRSRTRWTITMPSGASVKVTIRTWGRGGMNVYVNVPARDRGHTMGLCGTFDGSVGNDFRKSDRQYISLDNSRHWNSHTRTNINSFIESYRVAPQNSLFNGINEINDLLLSDDDFCSCNEYDPNTSRCGPQLVYDQFQSVVVSNTISTISVNLQNSNSNNINNNNNRWRRDTRGPRTDNVDDTYVFGPVEEDDSNPAPQGWPTWNNVTQQQAQDYCNRVLIGNVPSACTPVIDYAALGDIINACMDDVELTGQLIWAEDKVDSVVQLCTFTVRNSPDVVDMNHTVIASQLAAIASEDCPGQCSGKGSCLDGQCQCNTGFVGPDCSLSEGQAPEIVDILSPALCDVSERLCQSVRLSVDYLVISPTIACHLDARRMDGSGLTSETTGVAVSYNEVECPLSSLYTIDAGSGPAPFYRYNISLSNDGVVFSTQLSVPGAPLGAVVYDSNVVRCTREGVCTQIDVHVYLDSFPNGLVRNLIIALSVALGFALIVALVNMYRRGILCRHRNRPVIVRATQKTGENITEAGTDESPADSKPICLLVALGVPKEEKVGTDNTAFVELDLSPGSESLKADPGIAHVAV